MKKFLVSLLCLFSFSCGSSQLNADITKALIIDDSLQSMVQALEVNISQQISTLSQAQQAQYNAELTKFTTDANTGFQSKEDTLNAALAANAQTVDVTQVVNDILAIINDFVVLGGEVGLTPTNSQIMRDAVSRVALIKAAYPMKSTSTTIVIPPTTSAAPITSAAPAAPAAPAVARST